MPDFLDALATIAPLPPALRAALEAAVRRENLPARHQLLQPGQVARRVYFSIVSFLTQAPSTEYLELLEASAVHTIGYEQLQGLYRDFPAFNLFGRVITERYYVLSEQRAHQLRGLPAAARYERLLAEFPAVFQRVALKHIASHLGVGAETLSRLRGRG